MTASLKGTARETDVIGLLDVGTAKTVCLIVATGAAAGRLHVLGAGVCPTRGLKAGVVVEMDGVEQAIRGAVNDAERGAGVRLPALTMSVACGRLRAVSFSADAPVMRNTVGPQDLERLVQAGRAFAQRDGRVLLDLQCLAYRLDGVTCEHGPTGLAGRSLSADLVAVTADEAPLRNLMHVAERADVGTSGLVPAPYASGLAATTEEDRQLGVLCVDMGAGTTQLSMFAEGHLLASDVIPVGGNHLTFDIARTLSAPVLEAERIKKDYGTLVDGAGDYDEVITYSLAGPAGVERHQTTRGHMRQIVAARISSLLAHVSERVERTGLSRYAQRLMVLTGGASQLPGLVEATADIFDCPVRAASPDTIAGLPVELAGPAFSTVLGMALVPPAFGVSLVQAPGAGAGGGYLQRMGQWLRESF